MNCISYACDLHSFERGQYADMVQRGERPLGKQSCGEGDNSRD